MYDNKMKYAIIQLGKMLRERISNELQTYSIIIGGDFNMKPDLTREYLVMLSDGTDRAITSSGTKSTDWQFKDGPFSDSAGNFDKEAQNNVTLTIGDTGKIPTGTCCVTNSSSSSYGLGIYDQIYSNKLKITKYWTYGGNIEYDEKTGGILFSDHLPVYAKIELPASAPDVPAPSSGGSKRFTLRTNNNNNKPTSRKIRKSTSASTSVSMPTTRFTKKQHSHSKKHKTRRHKH
jgi:hypothetical protein